MEQLIEIPTNDGYLIYGTFNCMSNKTQKLIILIPGFADKQNHHLLYNASRFFKMRGYATYRFNLFTDQNKGRVLEKCSIETFIKDINLVIHFFKNKYDEIYIACHSLGFVVLDCHLQSIKKIALWEPTLALKQAALKSLKYIPSRDVYSLNFGFTFNIDKKLKLEWENINVERLLKKLKIPVCILMAEKNELKIDWNNNLKYLKVKYYYEEIKGSSHDFCEEDINDYLYETTIKWFNNEL